MIRTLLCVASMLMAPAMHLAAQHTGHGPPSQNTREPTQAGQDAFAAITEIVTLLESDSSTNWRTVDLEALRQHLVDMNNVVLQSSPRTRNVEGGALFIISAPAPVRPAVARMVTMHSAELNRMPLWRATVTHRGDVTDLLVVAKSPTDTITVDRIRGLGFIGLLATGSHHQAHHLAIAKGSAGGHSAKHD